MNLGSDVVITITGIVLVFAILILLHQIIRYRQHIFTICQDNFCLCTHATDQITRI